MDDIYEYAKRGDLHGIKSIKGQYDVNACDKKDKYTPLMWAAKAGHDLVVQYLTKEIKSIEIDKRGGWNESTALMKAVEGDHLPVLEVLCDAKADINLANDFKSTALMLAAERGHKSCVKYLVEKNAMMNSKNELGYSAMILAAENGHAEILDILCQSGADTAVQNQFGKTALIMAAEMNHKESVAVLLNAGANKDHQSKRGMTALMLATVKGNKEIVELLLQHKAAINLVNVDGESALINSFFPKDIELTKLLLRYEADKKVKDKHGCTPLMIASRSGRLDVVQLFFKDDEAAARSNVHAKSEDGSTACHFAAMKGHLIVIMCLIDHGADMKKPNFNGVTPLQLLARFYIGGSEKQFKDFVKNIGKHSELLEMLPEIFPRLKSPNAYLNNCFSDLLLALKKANDLDIVVGLVYLAVGIRLATESHPLEAVDLQDRLDTVNKMLLECMASDGLDDEENVSIIFQDRAMRSRESNRVSTPKFSKARGFMEGPLFLCVKHKLLPILGTRQVSIHVDKVFWGSIKDKPIRQIFSASDIFQMRTNGIYWRTCPAANFFLEGISKLIVLLLVGALVIIVYDPDHYQSGDGVLLEDALLVMVLGHLLHELGELQDNDWVLSDYLAEIWNYLDLLSLVLLSGWAFSRWEDGYSVCVDKPALECVEVPRFLNAKSCLIMSAIPMSFALLRYLSTFRGLGQLVLMTFAMMKDLGKFVIVFITSVLGFGIAFRGLFPKLEEFASMERTILTLYDAALGQHDFSIFFEDSHHFVGVGLYIIYISMTMVVLLNLVIARFSATHDEINEQSLQIWSMMKARYVQDFLLIEERSPFAMLPPPLNLICIILSPIHFAVLWIVDLKNSEYWDEDASYGQILHNKLMRVLQSLSTGFSMMIDSLGYAMDASYHFMDNFKSKEGSQMTVFSLISVSLTISDLTARAFKYSKEIATNKKTAFQFLLSVFTLATTPVTVVSRWLGYGKTAVIPSDDEVEKQPYAVISVCGTASDIMMSLVNIIPCAVYEISLCLADIKSQASSTKVYFACLTVSIIFFPFVFLAFVGVLLYETCFVRSVLEVDEKGEAEMKYDFILPHVHRSTKPLKLDPSVQYSTMNIKILRADFTRKDFTFFSKPSLYAIIKFGDSQQLVTKPVESPDMNPSWFEDKDFFIIHHDTAIQDKLVITIYDNYDRIMGQEELGIERWIANGRFEGPLDLKVNGTKSGAVNLAAKLLSSSRKKIERQPSVVNREPSEDSTRLLTKLSSKSLGRAHGLVRQASTFGIGKPHVQAFVSPKGPELTQPIRMDSLMEQRAPIFTDEDRERIFHGINESSSNFAKNPYAFEMYMEIKNQLEDLEGRLDKKAKDHKEQEVRSFADISDRLDRIESDMETRLGNKLDEHFQRLNEVLLPETSLFDTPEGSEDNQRNECDVVVDEEYADGSVDASSK